MLVVMKRSVEILRIEIFIGFGCNYLSQRDLQNTDRKSVGKQYLLAAVLYNLSIQKV